jgi:hypothetical protein
MRRLPPSLCLALAVASGCSSPEESDDPTPAAEPVLLSPTDHLVRASVALRGTRPSIQELQQVAADPSAVETIVDGYLESPEFGRTMRDLHAQSLNLRPDWIFYPAGFVPKRGLIEEDAVSINTSVMEAPLRLIESVIAEDRPYTEIVTAPYTVTNRVAARVWGLEHDGSDAWSKTTYDDGRGNAGILTDSWLYVRYQSTPSNANRARANAISRSLLCYDFLSRDVDLDTSIDTSDPDTVNAAVVSNPACASCHQALDPLASFFQDMFPLIVPTEEEYPVPNMYFPGIFETAYGIELRPRSYFGQPGESLEDLGRLIADDPRFASCAARRFYSYFNQVPLGEVPFEEEVAFGELFVESDFDAKALAKAIVLSDGFATSHAEDDATAETLRGLRRVRPDELATFITDKTGFVWTTELGPYTEGFIDVVELPRDSVLGYRVIGGGTDSQFVLFETHTETAASSLFVRAFAEEAAAYVVANDLARPATERKLLRRVEDDTRDEALLREQLALLVGELHSKLVGPDSEPVSELLEVFRASLEESDDPTRAWQTVLTAMLQDVTITYL